MPTTTETKAAVRTAKDDLRAAEVRLDELTEERNRVDDDLQEASVLAARQKAEAARAGESITAPAELDAVQLRERKQDLPYELHAQERYVHECRLVLYGAEDADRQARYEEAEAVFAEVAPRFKAVEKEYDEARRARIDPTRKSRQSDLISISRLVLSELEANPPTAGEDFSPGAVEARIAQSGIY